MIFAFAFVAQPQQYLLFFLLVFEFINLLRVFFALVLLPFLLLQFLSFLLLGVLEVILKALDPSQGMLHQKPGGLVEVAGVVQDPGVGLVLDDDLPQLVLKEL